MTNINDTKKKIENEVAKCTKSISTSYDMLVDQLTKQKEALSIQLKKIADQKLNELQKRHELMKKNSLATTTHINYCRSAINKKIDLMAIDQRKEHILKRGKTVQDFEITDQNNALITNCNINFFADTDKVTTAIKQFGHFKSIPVPILISLQSKCGVLNIKWKLENNDMDSKENEINKIKVEWTEIGNNDDEKLDDLKLDWNNKIFNVNNIHNDNNEVNIKLNKKIAILVR
eukprot:522055_1